MSRGLRKRAISVFPRNLKSKNSYKLLVSVLLILGWALYLFERSPELSRWTEAVGIEVSRFLYKRLYEPRCISPGVELGVEQPREMMFETCKNFSTPLVANPKKLRIYIFEHFANLIKPKDPAPPQLCSERDFHHILATNHTGFIVAESAPLLVLRSTYFQRHARRSLPQCPPRGRAARWVTSSGADTAQTAVLSVLAIDSDLKTKTHREFHHLARPLPLHALTSSTRRVQNRSRIIVGPSGRGGV